MKACLCCLAESGIEIISLIFDGFRSSLSTCNFLEESVKDPQDLDPWFYHPDTNEQKKVHIFFDPPHAGKSIRNNFAKYGGLYDGEDNDIEWKHIKKLVKVRNRYVDGLTVQPPMIY